jgi:hypothetical protein
LIEVIVDAAEWKPPENCAFSVRVCQQEQNSRVKEGCNEDGQEDSLRLACFRVNTDLFDQSDVNFTNNNVEDDDAVRDTV